MTTPRTGPRGVVAFLLAASVLALTGCGTRSAAAGDPQEPPAPSVAPSVDYAARAAAAAARHDALFPEIAARCADVGTGGASPDATVRELPADPEARKYAENHAFKQQVELTPGARCRGDAHAARIRAAVTGGSGGKGAPHTAEELRAVLTGLGYGFDAGGVYGSGAVNVSFVLSVPESGPCVTGRLGPPVVVQAHGAYVEGGCLEPRGGH
ncbi:hypothetical protein OHA37_33365 [Streptomyces sp. NBC_00335]|uniref:hypothetical protein n=1 Tax=unclassified Streptomyces TaxID=2593676 RepID=UPI00224E0494|nr:MULTISPECIES: hypothetical protein [unclassified Streptomyces]MCX5408730.1 hypothetical protein [Streptomyces sp. NBC_00086]